MERATVPVRAVGIARRELLPGVDVGAEVFHDEVMVVSVQELIMDALEVTGETSERVIGEFINNAP